MKQPTAILLILPLLLALVSCDADKSDLVPTGIALNEDNVLEVTFENQGESEVPSGKGDLIIFIDGVYRGNYALGNLADQSFRDPGSIYTLTTQFRLSGSNRRIGVMVDTDDEINESNELQNTYTRMITPPPASGPDFIIRDLSLDASDELQITVRNAGNDPSPANSVIDLRVIVDDNAVTDFTATLPALIAGGETTLAPPSPITIAATSEVRVLLNTGNPLEETDNMNNTREEILPDGPSYAPYTALLNQPDIASNIIWDRAGGAVTYNNWSNDRKDDIREAVIRLENGQPQALQSPPALVSGWISPDDAWSIFVQHVAHSLWIESNNLVPWSILGYNDSQLSNLLDSRNLMVYDPVRNQYVFTSDPTGRVTAWNPRANYRFLRNFNMIGNDQEETLYALTEWMRAHLRHWSSGDTYLDLFGYEGPPPADRVLYPLQGQQHHAAGCWGTTGLYVAVLRSINIPVEHQRTRLGSNNASHSRPYFPTLDLSMPHSDDVYTASLVPSGNRIPVSEMFYTSAEMESRFLNPDLDCDGADCNTVGEQASYQRGRDHLDVSWQYYGDHLLYQYAIHGENYVLESLQGPRIGGVVQTYAEPYFTANERQTMVNEIEAYLEILGGGDLDAGKQIVINRFQRFRQNM